MFPLAFQSGNMWGKHFVIQLNTMSYNLMIYVDPNGISTIQLSTVEFFFINLSKNLKKYYKFEVSPL